MASFSSSASTSDRPAWPSIWPGGEVRHPRVGRLSFAIRRHRGDGSVRRTDDLISPALWLVNHGAWSTTGFMVWRDRASDRKMDRKSNHASVWLGPDSLLSDPRSRWSFGEVFFR